MFLLLLLLFALTWLLCFQNCKKPHLFPPVLSIGPKWLPLFGSYLTVQKLKKQLGYLHVVFEKLGNTYGGILGLKLGRQKFVVLSGNHLIRMALMKPEFNGRPDGFFFRVRAFGKRRGILFTDGPLWSQTKRTTMKYLSDFGFGHKTMDNYLQIEAEILVSHFKSLIQRDGQLIAMHQVFDVAVLNTLWTIVAGYRFSYENSKLQAVLKALHKAFRSSDTLGGIISHLPFLRFIFPNLSGYSSLMAVLNELWGFIEEEIENHLLTLKSNQSPKSLIDAFLLHVLNNNESKSNCTFEREDLVVLCLDLFMAGTKTTADSLTAIFALLLHHPNYMKSLKDDLDAVVGRDNSPGLEHMTLLPRIEAFIAEAHRVLVLTPLGVPHRTMEDVSLEGYHIPMDTVVLFNFHSANTDDTCWDKPEDFCPERFLDENGLFRRKNEFILFGLGKRRCLGETLARQTIFLFFTNILHNFNLKVPMGQTLPRLDGIDGFTVSPRPYLVDMTLRN